MKIIDLSQAHQNNMTQFPGTPLVNISQICQIEDCGFRVTDFHGIVHTGTHCDAPAHFVNGGKTIDQMSLDHFVGEAIIVDVDVSNGREIPESIIDGTSIQAGDIVLFRSGFSKLWQEPRYIEDYPYLSTALAQRLVDLGVKSVGMDFLSPDPVDDDSVHQILLGNGLSSIENLNNLELITTERFLFIAAPVLINGSDGAFTRAIGIVDL